MIEIIPNWHPIFVHFTIGLFSTAMGFIVLSYITSFIQRVPANLILEFETVGRWCLWIVALMTLGTVLAGFYAYYTVRHDEISHMAMTIHRNWALSTAAVILLIAGWSIWRYRQKKPITWPFVLALLIGQGLVLSTAWHGGELVYRYGIGVLSLPQGGEVGHHHHREAMPDSHPQD